MNQKVIVGILLTLIFIVCMGIGSYIYKINELSNTKMEQITEVSDGKITDECTEEAEELLQANSTERKVSPNAIFILKREYEACGHTTKEYIDAPEDTINKTEQELKELYKEWEIEGFSNNEIVFKKKEEGTCNEHYVLREKEEKIVVYRLDENNNEELYQKTEIITKYLPKEDKTNIQNGIRVNGKEALNCLLEDYE